MRIGLTVVRIPVGMKTKTLLSGPLYTSEMKTSMPKQVAITVPRQKMTIRANGTWRS
jgi:hypothetical protein